MPFVGDGSGGVTAVATLTDEQVDDIRVQEKGKTSVQVRWALKR